MEQELILHTGRGLQADWELQLPDQFTEAELLRLLAARIARLLEISPEQFFQLMYRLDIDEGKLQQALRTADPTAALALLVYRRQLEKIRSRQAWSRPPANDEELLRW